MGGSGLSQFLLCFVKSPSRKIRLDTSVKINEKKFILQKVGLLFF